MEFTIGCDPELVARRDGYFVPAHEYFKFNSSFGTDGDDNICEIRPGFSVSAFYLNARSGL